MTRKYDFAKTLNEIDNGMPKTSDECFNYGITWGCDEDCPVFQQGKCELQQENKKMFKIEDKEIKNT